MTDHDELGTPPEFASNRDVLAELARIDFGRHDLHGVLSQVAELARQALVGDGVVSVTLIRDGEAYTAAATGEIALQLDEIQYRAASGPCFDAAAAGELLMVRDMHLEQRWPEFSKVALECGILSSLALNFPLQTSITGALNVYSTSCDDFEAGTVELGRSFADYAAVAIANAQLYESASTQARQLREAMTHRAVIDQAIGVIMAQRRCSHGKAFEALKLLSNTSNRKLREVAADLVAQVQDGPD
ncbi:MAG: GAF and ANTAR domain-containing protein [Sporichthyaceae bacterium]